MFPKLIIRFHMSGFKIRRLIVTVIFISTYFSVQGQKIATLEVTLPVSAYNLEIPVSVNLDEITYLADSLLSIYEVKASTRTAIPFQIEEGKERRLYWTVTGGTSAGEKHVYELEKKQVKQPVWISATKREGALVIHQGKRDLLSYFFTTVYPPAGIDSAYRRSGFIHPLWSPHGQVLTRIQPRDHYHHYGIWNPWTHVLYEGEVIDFWNINSRQGTVRFANFESIVDGSVYSEFEALHEHIVFKKDGAVKVAMNELHSARVICPRNSQDYFYVDFYFKMNCSDQSPVTLLEYRYAGLGWRTTGKWDNKNSMVLTSEGKTRKDADGSKARWCIVQGVIDDDYAGVVMMSFPTNYNYPEPLRIWPENQNGRGDMFANFCPTKDMDWSLMPGNDYVLKYRFLVFNGKTDGEKAESAWYYFANPPEIKITKSTN